MAGSSKKAPSDKRRQVPLRLGEENWRRVQMARIDSGISMQQLMFEAVDAWLRKQKREGLSKEEGQS